MVICTHCGQAVPEGLVAAGAPRQFCCGGCRAAWNLLNDGGLAEFYRLRAGAGDPAGRPAGEDPGAAVFDSEAFRRQWARSLPGGDEVVAWYLEGLHCPACTWLVEQLPRLLPGVRWARLDLGTAALRVAYDPQRAAPGAQARLLAALGYRARPYRSDAVSAALAAEHRRLLIRVAVAAASAVGTMHLAATLTAGRIGGDLEPAFRTGFAWAAILAALPGCAWAAWPIHRGAAAALRARRWSVDLAATLAIVLALGGSAVLAAAGNDSSYADAAAMFAALLLTARLAVVAARRRVARAAGGLAHLLPLTAWRRDAGALVEVPVERLLPGDVVEVAAGAVVPGDGTLCEGEAAVDIAVLTGEPRPVAVRPGDAVAAGATCRSGACAVRLEATGPDTRIARILAAASPQAVRDDGDGAAGRALAWLAPLTLLAAAAAGAWWGWHAGWATGAETALAVLVAACPCAIGLAAPLVHALAAAEAAREGLLVRDPAVLARIAGVGAVVCDKTGTLTEGRMRVLGGPAEHPAWPLALALSARSGHPASLAIAEHLRAQGVAAAGLASWREEPGRGVVADDLDGREIRLGGSALTGVGPGDGGATRIGLLVDGTLATSFDLDDPLRPGAHALVAAWRAAGAEVHLASGDHPAVVAARGAELGLDPACVHGGLAPEVKAALVQGLAQRTRVAAVGDGVNDAAMLAAADVAVGMSGGLEAALDRCHVFCARPAEAGPLELWAGAARARSAVRRLLWISAVYNALAVAGAAGGWFGPLVCAIAMPASSLTVVALALGTRCFPGLSPRPPSPGR